MLSTVILVVLILALLGALPTWGWSRGWGYSPMAVIVVLLLLWLFFGGNLV